MQWNNSLKLVHTYSPQIHISKGGKLEVVLDMGNWVPFWNSNEMWLVMREPALPLGETVQANKPVCALITLAAHHWFKAMFQKTMVWDCKCPFRCPWHDKNHSMFKSIFVLWTRGHFSHLDDGLITFCRQNAYNDLPTLVFVHERQGDVIAALLSTLRFFSHSGSCWLCKKQKGLCSLDEKQNSMLSCCSRFIKRHYIGFD